MLCSEIFLGTCVDLYVFIFVHLSLIMESASNNAEMHFLNMFS